MERLLGLDTRPFVNDVIGEVEVLGHVDLEVVVEVLVRVEFYAGAIFAEYVVHFYLFFLGYETVCQARCLIR